MWELEERGEGGEGVELWKKYEDAPNEILLNNTGVCTV